VFSGHRTSRGRPGPSDQAADARPELDGLVSPPETSSASSGHRSPLRATVAAALALLVVLALLGAGIVISQQDSKAQIRTNLGLRGTSSATFVSTFITQQAEREQEAAMAFLSGRRVSAERFEVLVAEFGSRAAVLLDRSGRLLDVVPADKKLLGSPIARRYAHLSAAEHGKVAVSNVVSSAVRGAPVAAIAVPFETPSGRRVFSAAYHTSDSTLEALVDHTIAYREHAVFLVDGSGRLLAASPATSAPTLHDIDPALARAVARGPSGGVAGARIPTTFVSTPVPGTRWHLIIAVPNGRLYSSIGGLTHTIPWVVLVIVSLLGSLLVALLGRSVADRARLANLARMLEKSAYTDALTGLFNRRALSEHLTRATAHARRRGEPLSILMIDLDYFKEINDRFGHHAGDLALCALADCLRDVARVEDVCGRWGGDEFVMIMPTTDQDGAAAVEARLLARASAVELDHMGVSYGIAASVGSASAIRATPDELLKAADVELYRAKAAQRTPEDASTV
jgi:diguanylate cyclase (GGDEF)-like protein